MKKVLKNILFYFCCLLVAPLILIFKIQKLVMPERQAIKCFSEFFSIIPGVIGVFLRKAFYFYVLDYCSKNSYIGFGTIFSTTNVEIYDNVYIGTYCLIGWAKLEENVIIASRVSIISGTKQHKNQALEKDDNIYSQVNIGKNSWIGEGAIVGANIRAESIVGAGAVVVKDCLDAGTYVGNPAKLLVKETL